ncbi:50S ribosomal protein L4 [Acholeplasma laidlawii]|jgi:large subunit ribosomal protein L4|uniref:Large ribosomal subunit protein uL4 n=2 Tax=Acholeplasma laidlawii TaxID=2148 RepID=RL4_ACHLI|nr:50S ribosomal protein L4 [Acholeplasma laidlawii]A9NED4.1 RecName: Full=Large ribosomal subunit protein uL4; AltName: Full=50S ribosomal protein L4 [Acholeplasma laidlawii PG-8A]ABX80714.1 large subunit ribosomal protein L4 [Acholeplasma laidlawii PG-8A]NWH10726.1 50S ribosomal protein L4 [Acholeplasma laidlawii]NWH12111.1 50S ribosomal protein L4 [Acholeplasma laidlawii]NWH12480.1 50S ribosomal protein L4 [Acholeplasma laidlawii]NWH14887.1 50S ribosomal protein L4 [Acholeplasma laidlawii]
MPTLNLFNQAGEKISEVALNDAIFGITPNQQVLYDVVNAQRAALRQGTAKTKTRAEVRGGGKKPWRQKGTGRARQGSIRSPQWRGGGIVFGPIPRSYAVKVNQKVKQLALKSALSYHVLAENLVLVDNITVAEPKTKLFIEIMNNLKLDDRSIVLVDSVDKNLLLASNNLPGAVVREVSQVSVYELLKFKQVVLTQGAVKYYEEVLV